MDGSELQWFKSSYSTNEAGSDCVEVAPSPGTVHVRDSKDAQGGRLAFAGASWSEFVAYTAYRA
ncbi:DUF397 domain-containing protein [Streptomyces sp. NBC_00828]